MQARRDGLLDALYGAAVEPDLWPRAIEHLSDHLGGTGAWLSRLSMADGRGEGVVSRIDPEMMGLYDRYYSALNPFSTSPDPEAFMAGWRPTVLTNQAWLPNEQLVRQEYFNDFMRPQDIHNFMIIRLAAQGIKVSAITINRPGRRDPFGREEVARARRIHHHVRRAFRMTEALVDSGLLDDDLERGASGQPAFVLDPVGRIRRMTPAAEQLLARRDELTAIGGVLSARHDPGGRLAGLIATAGSPDPAVRAGGGLTLAASAARPPLTLHVAPAQSDRVALFRHRPAVLVTVSEPVSESGPSLTARERDVLTWVAEGKSDWEIGVILGVSEPTVRFHLDNARRKLDASNRAHAVARFLRG